MSSIPLQIPVYERQQSSISEALNSALDRLRRIESMVESWEERIRLCEVSRGINPMPAAFSTFSCSVRNCSNQRLDGSVFCDRHASRACMHEGCTRSRLGPQFCIRHGGGRRCQYPGCPKGASGCLGGEKRFCIAHGGGRKCSVEGCSKTAKKGGRCSSHGGRYECLVKGCRRSSLGSSKLCVLHGGTQPSGDASPFDPIQASAVDFAALLDPTCIDLNGTP